MKTGDKHPLTLDILPLTCLVGSFLHFTQAPLREYSIGMNATICLSAATALVLLLYLLLGAPKANDQA